MPKKASFQERKLLRGSFMRGEHRNAGEAGKRSALKWQQ
jgi:hypothetical protein